MYLKEKGGGEGKEKVSRRFSISAEEKATSCTTHRKDLGVHHHNGEREREREGLSLSLFRYIKINPKKGNGHTHARCDRSSSIDWDRGCFGGYFYISLERCGSWRIGLNDRFNEAEGPVIFFSYPLNAQRIGKVTPSCHWKGFQHFRFLPFWLHTHTLCHLLEFQVEPTVRRFDVL